jgi:hypothetical protein
MVPRWTFVAMAEPGGTSHVVPARVFAEAEPTQRPRYRVPGDARRGESGLGVRIYNFSPSWLARVAWSVLHGVMNGCTGSAPPG